MTGTVRPSGRSTNIESASSAAEESMTGLNTITAVQWTRSRAHFRTSQVHRGVWQLHASTSPPPGQKWPERLRSLSKPRGRRFDYLLGSAEPSARPDRSKRLHGCPAWTAHARVMQGLAGWSARRRGKRGLRTFFGLSIKIHTQTVPGSHRALPGDLGGGRGEPRSAPTSRTAPTSGSRCGKGL